MKVNQLSAWFFVSGWHVFIFLNILHKKARPGEGLASIFSVPAEIPSRQKFRIPAGCTAR